MNISLTQSYGLAVMLTQSEDGTQWVVTRSDGLTITYPISVAQDQVETNSASSLAGLAPADYVFPDS